MTFSTLSSSCSVVSIPRLNAISSAIELRLRRRYPSSSMLPIRYCPRVISRGERFLKPSCSIRFSWNDIPSVR